MRDRFPRVAIRHRRASRKREGDMARIDRYFASDSCWLLRTTAPAHGNLTRRLPLKFAGGRRLRMVQCVHCKIGQRELSLSQLGTKHINGIVSARNVLGKADLRQKRGARQSGSRFGVLVTGARNRSLRVLPQGLIDGLPKRQRFLPRGGQIAAALLQRHLISFNDNDFGDTCPECVSCSWKMRFGWRKTWPPHCATVPDSPEIGQPTATPAPT